MASASSFEPVLGEQREDRLEGHEGHREPEADPHDPARSAPREKMPQTRLLVGYRPTGGSALLRVRLREEQVDRNGVHTRHPRGDECRDGKAPSTQEPPQSGPDHEPESESRPDEPEIPGPVLGRADVGHVRLGYTDVATREPVQHP